VGSDHSLGLKTDGSIVAWGSNSTNQCDVPLPNTGFVVITAGYAHSLAIRRDSDADGVADSLDACPDTIAGAPVDVNGCPVAIPFDFDGDGDVDGGDLEVFVSCHTGPAIVGPPAGCTTATFDAADRDHDGDVDQDDWGVFQRCYSGAGRLGDPACAG
jgi:hypothetical protein